MCPHVEQSKIGTSILEHFLPVLPPKIICNEKSLPRGLLDGPDLGYLKVQTSHCFRNVLLLVPIIKRAFQKDKQGIPIPLDYFTTPLI